MKVKYLRGYDPERDIEVISISADTFMGVAHLILTLPDGEDVVATYLEDQGGLNEMWVAGCPENF